MPCGGAGQLGVLSLGFTRSLWDGDGAEDVIRLRGYAEGVRRYAVVVNAYRRHGLRPITLSAGFTATPTNARTPFGSFVRMLRLGFAELTRGDISLVQAQDPVFSGLAALLLGRRFGVPVNVCVYGPNVFDLHWKQATRWSALQALIGRYVLRHAHGIQVDGRLTANRLIEAGISSDRIALKAMVVANLDDFLALTRSFPSAQESVRLLFVGHFNRQKNLPLLAQAFRLARQMARVPLELELVGSGVEEPRLRRLLAEETACGAVRWTGMLRRDKVPEAFGGAQVFVLSSWFEGFPRVLVEAAASALPAVCTAVSGADEAIVDGVSGYIVPVGDAGIFARRIVDLAESPERRASFGVAARTHIGNLFRGYQNTDRQLSIWADLVARTPRPAND
jgi:glycosyltransferase involved in cell wall biosynthesis